jgi:hypothetical protein
VLWHLGKQLRQRRKNNVPQKEKKADQKKA